MTYLDVKRLQTIDPASFRAQTPYPWVNPVGLLTDAGYDRLRETLPDISLFTSRFGETRVYGHRITIASPSPMGMIYRSPRPGKRSLQNCVAQTIKRLCVGSLGLARLSSPSSGTIPRRAARSHRIATPNVSWVPLFFISTRSKIGIPPGVERRLFLTMVGASSFGRLRTLSNSSGLRLRKHSAIAACCSLERRTLGMACVH